MWKKYRTIVEILQAFLLSALPFLSVNGQSAFRFDIGELKLYFFGSVIWIREFYLILAATLFFLLLITFVTTIFGRIWCGWLCPQTVLLDLSDGIAKLFGRKKRKTVQKVLLLPFSALVSLTMFWYFVPPARMMHELFVSTTITLFFFVLWACVYLELAFMGRKFCTSVCPYAMLQNALFDKDTVVIEYDVSRDDTCMKCDECVRVCPVGIDIKKGLSTSCIACAECIDVCRAISEKRGMPPFPDYKGKVLRPKTFWMGGITIAAAVSLFLLIWTRPPVDFLVTRDSDPLPAGLNRYSYTIYSNNPETLVLELSSPDPVTLIGDRTVTLQPFSALRGKIMIKTPEKIEKITLSLKGKNISINRETGFL
ncbi:MAG: 4Fe-4S binding protein [Chlorobium sp.]|nr:MAG: 4Fe-4S binding protein [Chlorobium sp.]